MEVNHNNSIFIYGIWIAKWEGKNCVIFDDDLTQDLQQSHCTWVHININNYYSCINVWYGPCSTLQPLALYNLNRSHISALKITTTQHISIKNLGGLDSKIFLHIYENNGGLTTWVGRGNLFQKYSYGECYGYSF